MPRRRRPYTPLRRLRPGRIPLDRVKRIQSTFEDVAERARPLVYSTKTRPHRWWVFFNSMDQALNLLGLHPRIRAHAKRLNLQVACTGIVYNMAKRRKPAANPPAIRYLQAKIEYFREVIRTMPDKERASIASLYRGPIRELQAELRALKADPQRTYREPNLDHANEVYLFIRRRMRSLLGLQRESIYNWAFRVYQDIVNARGP